MPTSATEALLGSWHLSLHRLAPRTVDLYLQEARRFARWLVESGRPDDLTRVQRRDVEAWLSELRARGLSQSTLRSRWIVLRNLYGWLTEEDEVDANPLERVKVDKPSPPAPDVLTDEEIKALLKACEGREFPERRDLALIRFLLATGVRVSECCDLLVEDLDLRNRIAHVRHGKGDRARLVRYDAATGAALDRYLRIRARHRLAALPALWIGHRGKVTRKGVPSILVKRATLAGIDHVHAHQLRHTWAHRWLVNGGTEGDLQRLGGWEGTEVMRRYGEARAVDRALAAYDKINPLGS